MHLPQPWPFLTSFWDLLACPSKISSCTLSCTQYISLDYSCCNVTLHLERYVGFSAKGRLHTMTGHVRTAYTARCNKFPSASLSPANLGHRRINCRATFSCDHTQQPIARYKVFRTFSQQDLAASMLRTLVSAVLFIPIAIFTMISILCHKA